MLPGPASRLASLTLAIGAAWAVTLAALAPPAGAHPALATSIQDDVQFLQGSPAAVREAMAQVRALGIDRVRLTASWSGLAPAPDSVTRPAFDATDPSAYEQAKWRSLDLAVRAAREAGLSVLMDIGFWAPRWAGRGPGPRVRGDIDAQEFAGFAEAVARRYSGTFTPPLAARAAPPTWSPSSPPVSAAPPAPMPAPSQPGPLGSPPLVGPTLAASSSGARSAPAAQARLDPGAGVSPGAAAGPLPAADIFSLWNEPNHPAFLEPQWRTFHGKLLPASPRVYRPMVRLGYATIKSVRPDATVLIGNTSSFGGTHGRDPVPPLGFLRALACVDARFRPLRTPDCRHFRAVPGDGWAHHPYSLTGTPAKVAQPGHPDDLYLGNLRVLVRSLDRLVAMGRLARGLRSIYLTEYGYETHRLGDRPGLPEAKQARYLTWGEYLASRFPTVKLFGQFLLRDTPPSAVVQSDSLRRPNGQFYTGLEHADGSPKLALRSFVAGLFAQRARRHSTLLWGRLRLGRVVCHVVIQRKLGAGPWRSLPTARRPGARTAAGFTTLGQASFLRFARTARTARFRMLYRSNGGPPVTGLAVRAVGIRAR